jgi:molybdenum cofactor guanylyltransferase
VTRDERFVTALVLAGGRSTRMGTDKAFVEFGGRPMIAHVLDAVRPQADAVLVSANAGLERYAALGVDVVTDLHPARAGPLAGIAAGLRRARHGCLLVVPCDAPRLPADLARRLGEARSAADADAAVAHDGVRLQPLFLLLHTRVAPGLEAHVAAGGRRADAWLATLRTATVDFADRAASFANVNDPAELERLERESPGHAPTRSVP